MAPTVAAAVRRRSSSSNWLGGISCSWSRELGTLCTPMNNGEVARGREEGRELLWRRQEEEEEEEGLRQRCSSDWRGGSSTGFVLLGCTHCCSAWFPLLSCISLSLPLSLSPSLYFNVFLFFTFSLPPSSVSFFPASPSNTLNSEHMI